VAQGELGGFVPGAIDRAGDVTRVLPDTLGVRVWIGYFFVSVPVRIGGQEGWIHPPEDLNAVGLFQSG
jgi:hypothetical protein